MFTTALRRGCVPSGLKSSGRARNLRACKASAAPPTLNLLGGIFGGGESGEKREGKNDDILKWARAAKMGTQLAPAAAPDGLDIATFAGTSVGYTQGKLPGPTYEQVCSGSTGHTEAVQVYFDPSEGSYDELLDVFFQRTDPTTLNRQGNDRGTQYRSGIYYHTPAQKAAAEAAVQAVQAAIDAGTFRRVAGNKVVVEVKAAEDYYLAEDYHQQYLAKGGRGGRPQSAAKGCNDPIRCYG